MAGLVGGEASNDFRGDGIALINQFLEPSRHRRHVMKHHQISHQVVVADEFALLFAVFCRITPSPPKATHCTNWFHASTVFVEAVMVRRSSSSLINWRRKMVRTTRPSSRKAT